MAEFFVLRLWRCTKLVLGLPKGKLRAIIDR